MFLLIFNVQNYEIYFVNWIWKKDGILWNEEIWRLCILNSFNLDRKKKVKELTLNNKT